MSDQKPPQIDNGSFVSWSNGKGRVDLIVTSGKVPGVDSDVEATSDSPAARVVVWSNGKPTREKIAASTHTLRRIPPLDAEGKADPADALVALASAHETKVAETGQPEHAALTGVAIKTAYDRGLASWPGETKTSLTAEEWALGRAQHLCKMAVGEAESGNDADLLHSEHPAAAGEAVEPEVEQETPEDVDEDEVVVDADEVKDVLDAIEKDSEETEEVPPQ